MLVAPVIKPEEAMADPKAEVIGIKAQAFRAAELMQHLHGHMAAELAVAALQQQRQPGAERIGPQAPQAALRHFTEFAGIIIGDESKRGISGGQRKRVNIGLEIVADPIVLFLDEPTASLDPDIGDFVRKYIEEYKSKNKISILLASHNMKEVERLCDQVIMMKEGKIVDRGTCQSLIDKHGRNNLEETFLKLARNKNELE